MKLDISPKARNPFGKSLRLMDKDEKVSSKGIKYRTYAGYMRYLITKGRSPWRKQYLEATSERKLKEADRRTTWEYVEGLDDIMVGEVIRQIKQRALLYSAIRNTYVDVCWEGPTDENEQRWLEIVRRAVAHIRGE